MLVLSRKSNDSVCIGHDIIVTVVEIRGDKVRLGITAPAEVPVHRHEVYQLIHGSNAATKAVDAIKEKIAEYEGREGREGRADAKSTTKP